MSALNENLPPFLKDRGSDPGQETRVHPLATFSDPITVLLNADS